MTLTQIHTAAAPGTPVRTQSLLAASKGESREDVGRRFESLFLKKLVEELRVSAGGDEGMFGSGPGSGIQEDWFDQIFADHLADTGRFGFAKMLPQEKSDA
jgi:Rod binding domain-containing protein